MLFIAEDPVRVVVRGDIEPLYDTQGRMIRPHKRRLYAQFKRGTAPRWAQEIGVPMFDWRRKPIDVPPELWLAYYDSVEDQEATGWDEEERALIEEKLLTVGGVVHVEPAPLTPPWPNYDKLVVRKGQTAAQLAKRVVDKVREDGHDPHHVLAYERQNRNRATVIEALEELVNAPVEAEEEEVDEESVVVG